MIVEFSSIVLFYFLFTYGVIRKARFSTVGRRELDDAFGWLFIDNKPLLYEMKRVARQSQVETWLDLAQVLKELGIERPTEGKISSKQTSYVI